MFERPFSAREVRRMKTCDIRCQRNFLSPRTSELVTRQKAYASDMNRAQQALAQNNLSSALELLNRHRPLLSATRTNSNSRFPENEHAEKDLRGWQCPWC